MLSSVQRWLFPNAHQPLHVACRSLDLTGLQQAIEELRGRNDDDNRNNALNINDGAVTDAVNAFYARQWFDSAPKFPPMDPLYLVLTATALRLQDHRAASTRSDLQFLVSYRDNHQFVPELAEAVDLGGWRRLNEVEVQLDLLEARCNAMVDILLEHNAIVRESHVHWVIGSGFASTLLRLLDAAQAQFGRWEHMAPGPLGAALFSPEVTDGEFSFIFNHSEPQARGEEEVMTKFRQLLAYAQRNWPDRFSARTIITQDYEEPIHLACGMAFPSIVKWLLEVGHCSPEAMRSSLGGSTPLCCVGEQLWLSNATDPELRAQAEQGVLETVKILLDHGARPLTKFHLKDDFGYDFVDLGRAQTRQEIDAMNDPHHIHAASAVDSWLGSFSPQLALELVRMADDAAIALAAEGVNEGTSRHNEPVAIGDRGMLRFARLHLHHLDNSHDCTGAGELIAWLVSRSPLGVQNAIEFLLTGTDQTFDMCASAFQRVYLIGPTTKSSSKR